MLTEVLRKTSTSREIEYSPEKPKRTALVTFPQIDVSGAKTRLGMHTDNMRVVLGFLYFLPEADQLKIEGRVISDEQLSILNNNRVYRFFMHSRMVRSRHTEREDVLAIMVPNDVDLGQKEVVAVSQLPFSPSDLADDIGFETGFYDVSSMVSKWKRDGRVSEFIPLFGGVNEFRIGSDTLTQEELERIRRMINRRLEEVNISYLNLPVNKPVSLSPNFSKVVLTTPFSKTNSIVFSDSSIEKKEIPEKISIFQSSRNEKSIDIFSDEKFIPLELPRKEQFSLLSIDYKKPFKK